MKRYASYDYESSNEDNNNNNNIKTTTSINHQQLDATSSTTTTTTYNTSNINASNHQTIKRIRSTSSSNKIGGYIIGPKLNGFNYGSINQYLCRKLDSSDFFILKILNVDKDYEKESRMLLHNEYALLTILKDVDGVIHHHGLFRENNCINGEKENSEKLCLILDCYLRHEYDNKHYFTNLQHYIFKQKYFNEREALALLYKLFKIIEIIHKKNIVHRDLKLGNIIYDLNSQRVFLVNFCLGHQLVDENELLNEQFGSPAYISPDVLSNLPYYGKPNDIWSLGVILYTMLVGHLPFYDPNPDRLFKKIKSAEYVIPSHIKISDNSKLLIKNILQIDPLKRFNASEVLDSIMSILATHLCKSLIIDTRNNQYNNSNKKRKTQEKCLLSESKNDEMNPQTDLTTSLRKLTTNDNNEEKLIYH